MIAIQQQRKAFLASVVFAAGVTLYAAVSVGIAQATAFAPVFLGMWLLERNRSR